MKILLLSDCHFRSQRPRARRDNPIETAKEKLGFIGGLAKEDGIDLLLQAGDLTHGPKNWEVFIMLTKWLIEVKLDFLTIFGQHDMEFRNRNKTILETLSNLGLVKILNGKEPLNRGEISIWGVSFGEEIPQIESGDVFQILVIHDNITNSQVPYDYKDALPFLKRNKNFDLILCGDIHRKFIVEDDGRFIVNTGPLFRGSIDELNNKPCIFILDTKKRTIKEIKIPTKDDSEILDIVFDEPEINEELIVDISGIDRTEIDFRKILLDTAVGSDLYKYFNGFFTEV